MNAPHPRQRWRIGDLSAATGLTIRALHHYEQLGLLGPVRNDGNRRLYDRDDIATLYRIRAMKALGVSLTEIGPRLDGEPGALEAVIDAHLAHVDGQVLRLRAGPAPHAGELLSTIEAMSRLGAPSEGKAP
jgi:DNA-binding transcriptional MerR regulator